LTHALERLAVVTSLTGILTMASCGSEMDPTATDPGDPPEDAAVTALAMQLVASGLDDPLDLQAPPGDSRLFVVEQPGRIRIVRDGNLLPQPFLDLSRSILGGFERGLLGLAFHPDYAANGRFFVNYTDGRGDTRIAEFRVSSDPDRADPGSERLVLGVAQPFQNHNGGGLAFGPDGYLYAGLGDGGSGGDPFDNAQNLGVPLGKMLRLDVDGALPFAIPPDNPFASEPGVFPAIWAYGLRNPWRFAFDAETGDLYIADVGQELIEEIDVGFAQGGGGENYGWNVTEGSLCFSPSSGCSTDGITMPVLEYDHGDGCSVTGGYVYRGSALSGLQGVYFYSDFCTPFVRSFRLAGGRATEATDWTAQVDPEGRLEGVLSFGTDASGELYILDRSGSVYRVVPAQ